MVTRYQYSKKADLHTLRKSALKSWMSLQHDAISSKFLYLEYADLLVQHINVRLVLCGFLRNSFYSL